MTNAIDILCVGGPQHATVVCMNRKAMTTTIAFDNGAVYQRKVWLDPSTGLQYHVATQPGEDEPGDGEIALEVALSRFPAAWDLR